MLTQENAPFLRLLIRKIIDFSGSREPINLDSPITTEFIKAYNRELAEIKRERERVQEAIHAPR